MIDGLSQSYIIVNEYKFSKLGLFNLCYSPFLSYKKKSLFFPSNEHSRNRVLLPFDDAMWIMKNSTGSTQQEVLALIPNLFGVLWPDKRVYCQSEYRKILIYMVFIQDFWSVENAFNKRLQLKILLAYK